MPALTGVEAAVLGLFMYALGRHGSVWAGRWRA